MVAFLVLAAAALSADNGAWHSTTNYSANGHSWSTPVQLNGSNWR